MLIALCIILALSAIFFSILYLKERQKNRAFCQERENLASDRAALREFVLGQIIQGHTPEFEHLEQFYRIYGLHFDEGAFMLLIAKLRNHPFGDDPAGQKTAYAAVQAELSGMLECMVSPVFIEQEGMLVCFYNEPRVTLNPPSANQGSLRELLAQQCMACAASLMDRDGLDVILVLGEYDLGGFALHTNYVSAKAILEQAVCSHWNGNVVVDAEELEQKTDTELTNEQRQFYNCFICFHYQAAAEHLFHMVELRISNYCDTFREAREIVAREIRFCTSLLELPFNVLLELEDGSTLTIRDVMFSPDAETLRANLNRYFEGLKRLNDSGVAQAAPMTKRIYDYIESHYRDPELTVSSISEKFSLNISYISRQFKQAYGRGILDFIHSCRIAEAKKLMAEGIPISEVWTVVGYTSRRTFDSAFNRQEGITPKAYQNCLLSD